MLSAVTKSFCTTVDSRRRALAGVDRPSNSLWFLQYNERAANAMCIRSRAPEKKKSGLAYST